MKVEILIQCVVDRTTGRKTEFVIHGNITKTCAASDRDIIAQLFAMEFAANSHAPLPIRVHTSIDDLK